MIPPAFGTGMPLTRGAMVRGDSSGGEGAGPILLEKMLEMGGWAGIQWSEATSWPGGPPG